MSPLTWLGLACGPGVTYSDFFGDAPFRAGWDWFTLYWLLFCGLLSIGAVLFWPRGKQRGWVERVHEAGLRFRGGLRPMALVCLLLFAATGAWIAYNTMVLNPLFGPTDLLREQADYEKRYKPFDKLPQPRPLSVKYWIDIYPESRGMAMRGETVIHNPYPQPLPEIHFTVDRNYHTQIEVPGAVLAKDDARLGYRIYRFTAPLQPGESRTMRFTVESHARGFENSVSNLELVQNGTFFNNSVAPLIGYRADRELDDANDRRKCGLKEIDLMPALERHCTADCMENYIGGHSDWVDVDTVIGTSPDQIAVAPGSLKREWRGEGGRHYFEYKLDHSSLGFYSFISANYQVAREEWNGIKLEVYYLKAHPWNVPRMLDSMRRSLDYYTRNFGPYAHQEARIIEFPRVARFAQAFPGTMPYSEAIGFIANLNHPDDIDLVSYVVAHEMGHQWWAHQVIGANMEGATLLSETMAQYSAFMVMEKEYGRDLERKFLKYEMDRYLQLARPGADERASTADCGGQSGLRSLPQGQRGDVLPERDDWRRSREPGAAHGGPAVCLCAPSVPHLLGVSGCIAGGNPAAIPIPVEGSVRRYHSIFEPDSGGHGPQARGWKIRCHHRHRDAQVQGGCQGQ